MNTLKEDSLIVGIDVGSTTVKGVVLDSKLNILFSNYKRHFSDIKTTASLLIEEICSLFPDNNFNISVAGSGGISIAKWLNIPFSQEVIASTATIRKIIPQTDVAIELGGEDAKITFLTNGLEQRMNESCAGGTGAFIDQMASVIQTDASGLNDLAAKSDTIYPIAARCGVFAKTDVMPLLNEGAKKEDIAASILQAVVDQTVGGLACGRSIKGKIAFLGGPLNFLPQLRKHFIDTLEINEEDIIFPENAQFFVAIGAAILAQEHPKVESKSLLQRVKELKNTNHTSEVEPLEPLFKNEIEIQDFLDRHNKNNAKKIDISSLKGDVYLGVDAGSTTTKAVIIDDNNQIAYTYYGSNKGTPLASVISVLEDIYSKLPDSVIIKNTCATGYGESLMEAALGFDLGEVETLAHCKAATYFEPNVSFILDIGGQDMKCLYVKDGSVDKIILNEACSSGCGSFVETFANSLGMPVKDFAIEALRATNPVDLGSRCTVFMNSKVKQAQKEGSTVADISAGLSYSIIKNALYKVVKVNSAEELGDKIVVQGGTFFNNAILRALEKSIGVDVIRPDIAGLMGAFGAALIAKEKKDEKRISNIIKKDQLSLFTVKTTNYRCKLCSNKCIITLSRFSDNKKFITGNRCEKGAGITKNTDSLPNLYEYKYNRLFDYYIPLEIEKATRGIIGIPRVLNMYENYPYWFTLFTSLGYRVELSSKSSHNLFASGLETIPSQTVCFPAKMVHGHINDLIKRGIDKIFYPAIPYEKKEFLDADNNFNCPVVANYPEVIRLNVDSIIEKNIDFIQPYLPIDNPKKLSLRLHETFSKYGITLNEIKIAVQAAEKEHLEFKNDMQKAGEKTLDLITKKGSIGIVLSGRPYHLDPAINHGIPDLIASNNVAILTEDSIAHLSQMRHKIEAIDQWVYHSRLYRAADFVADKDNLELVQLNSFGCGLDAVTTEQVEEILTNAGKSYTLLKIDEGSNLGAVKIRIRSLLATVKDNKTDVKRTFPKPPPIFDNNMKSEYTILCPQLSPIHFSMLANSLKPYGYNIEVLPTVSKADIEEGLKYVNNDACFPAIAVVGQLIHALKSGKYDNKKVAVIISQTGGGCRATNYVRFLRLAADRAGFNDIPVIPFNMASALSGTSAEFKITIGAVQRMLVAFLYGDILLRVTNRTRPYEVVKGSVDKLASDWIDKLSNDIIKNSRSDFKRNIAKIIKDFDTIEINDIKKPKVGVVGEILVKFHPDANNKLVSVIENEGGEAVVPDFMDFILYCSFDSVSQHKMLAGTWFDKLKSSAVIKYIEWYRGVMRQELIKSKRFTPFHTLKELTKLVEGIVSHGNQTGEGWLLTAEMIELIHSGAPNIVLVQPFACLPNHITGKGVMKELKKRYNEANIVAVDYDPGATEVNQLNRIKLMMSVAFDNMKKKETVDI